jgi:hypothetical protein
MSVYAQRHVWRVFADPLVIARRRQLALPLATKQSGGKVALRRIASGSALAMTAIPRRGPTGRFRRKNRRGLRLLMEPSLCLDCFTLRVRNDGKCRDKLAACRDLAMTTFSIINSPFSIRASRAWIASGSALAMTALPRRGPAGRFRRKNRRSDSASAFPASAHTLYRGKMPGFGDGAFLSCSIIHSPGGFFLAVIRGRCGGLTYNPQRPASGFRSGRTQ